MEFRLDRKHLAWGLVAAPLAVAPLAFLLTRLGADIGIVFLIVSPIIFSAALAGGLAASLSSTLVAVSVAAGLCALAGGSPPWLEAGVLALLGLAAGLFGERLTLIGRPAIEAARGLKLREAHLESILATVPDAMMVIDEQGVIQSFSQTAERLFGYAPHEACGRNVSMLMPSPYREQHDDYLDRYRSTGERRIIGVGRVVTGERKDGSTFPIELAIGEVEGSGARLFTGFVRDLSERQRTETRLHELQDELVHVSRLTALGEMSSALAHELNQPLAAIGAYLSGLRRAATSRAGLSGEKAQEILERAADQAQRAGEIIRRLRDFVTKGETRRRPESLSRLTDEAVALAFVGARSLDVRLQVRLDPALDAVVVDRVQIQQVLLNLIRNALEAMAGGERRDLLIHSEAAEAGMVRVIVADTGPGLSEEMRTRLWQPFVTTKAQGMGVGLSICRTIIEAHGGRIEARNAPEGGARFELTLPMLDLQARRDD